MTQKPDPTQDFRLDGKVALVTGAVEAWVGK